CACTRADKQAQAGGRQSGKQTSADLRALLDENSVQSISELAEELNIDRTTVIKCLYTKKKIIL
ncbi:hypothetical protein ALC56_08178, partial [Trachymyrmex septentrionalis]